ncbi:MAG TPA: hypothetical protein VM115_02120 [Vicinamibacterales bacterium]|nr:hypothetical protein [Vicinamibacterales bacterium]
MDLRKIAACTVCAVMALAAAGCADGTGQALTPTLPSPDASTSNADGTKLKASAPQPLSPQSAVRITNLTPQLVLQNGAGTYASAALAYVFEVFEVVGSTQTLVIKSDPIAAGTTQTTFNIPANTLKVNKTYAWRAYAVFSGVQGSLSDGVSFRTPVPPPVDGPVSCGGSSGPSIIQCVAAAYPARLAKVSLQARKDNMEFIRDRIIETGICKGNDWGRNFKRGTPVISHDYLIERRPGQHDRGIDLASGYDDVSGPLKLTWQIKGPPDYGFPFYAKYPPVDCSGVN